MVCEGAAKGQAFREGASWVNKRLEKRLLIYPWLRELPGTKLSSHPGDAV
ncbi:hypothetical protein [Acetivibrio thermocellus]|nr:hypothetical protein [Acetivibrio thermocellus]NLU27119.1 hypothetical protein [Acetivibrio thermocellus]UWV47410.1 hypothetical protein N1236_02505 [Acetivibrio thermocellus]HOP93545.1 hypothetical protein [Acetivibrio thermocellus]